MAPVPVAPSSLPSSQHQLETMVSDIAVVRRIVERLAAIQEQMAGDFATLQKSDQNVRQKVSLPPHSPAAVPPRKYAPSIARSDVLRTHPPYLSRPLPLEHSWRRNDHRAPRLLGCIRARPRMFAKVGAGGRTIFISPAFGGGVRQPPCAYGAAADFRSGRSCLARSLRCAANKFAAVNHAA